MAEQKIGVVIHYRRNIGAAEVMRRVEAGEPCLELLTLDVFAPLPGFVTGMIVDPEGGPVYLTVYSGTSVALFGMPLCLSSLFGLGIMLLVIPLFLNRMKIEEALLIEEFGAEYESYRETTKKLIPFVY